IVINKPVGMVVHPAAGNPSGTLVNALLYHCGESLSGVGGVIRPGIVHRIDKDTSGLLVVAKNDEAHLALSAQLKEHHVSRIYTAVAIGNFREEEGTVNAPIGRHPVDRKKMAVIHNSELRSREAVTHWSVLARGEADGNSFTLLRCQLETGRTHQIRVHMASVGHPLLGDAVYGGANTRFESRHRASITGQCLHAGELRLTHPRTGEEMQFFAPIPANMQHVVDILFKNEEETV
ncbi:MAG: RluA family pseudouridine synthase, partial [Clostridia bacterium]|nr:RluA family pseudouridine synthase [Clostridia bacterium]